MTNLNADIRKEKVDTINELIQVTRDGAEFYHDAAKSVDNPQLRSLFDSMANSKNGLVSAMSREVRSEGEVPAKAGTFRGTLHQLYASIRAKINADKGDYAYVSELEESEDRLMKEFNDVLQSDDAPLAVKKSLLSYLPTVQSHHDAMRDRKWQMQARN